MALKTNVLFEVAYRPTNGNKQTDKQTKTNMNHISKQLACDLVRDTLFHRYYISLCSIPGLFHSNSTYPQGFQGISPTDHSPADTSTRIVSRWTFRRWTLPRHHLPTPTSLRLDISPTNISPTGKSYHIKLTTNHIDVGLFASIYFFIRMTVFIYLMLSYYRGR